MGELSSAELRKIRHNSAYLLSVSRLTSFFLFQEKSATFHIRNASGLKLVGFIDEGKETPPIFQITNKALTVP